MTEKFVITIARQYGSGGLTIAKKLAQRFGINFYDKELIAIAAKKSGLGQKFLEEADERASFGIFGSITGWFSSFINAPENVSIDNELFKIQSDIIKQLARKESCIFVGRCADYVLRENPRCVSVFISANIEDRIKTVLQRNNTAPEKIAEEIERIDKQRAKYYNFYSGRAWGAAQTYQLCINSSVLGIDETAEYIAEFAKRQLTAVNS
ncbi:MAG: cytidylate kinase-like family protein [Endomicrobia bacterium]|nr:cytidylate kinase-like family protein [Endomicrobiia bacterium]